MSLTFSTAYEYETKTTAFNEIWFAKLYYGAEGSSDFIGISTEDIKISGVQYYGIVSDFGEITEEINLAKSQAAISDVSIECNNVFKSGLLSDELYGSTNEYLNRKVEIFSYLNGNTLQLYTGRLININFGFETITLSVEGYQPWNKIKIPQTRSTLTNGLAPVVYGSYSAGSATYYYNKKELYPLPLENRQLNNLYFRTHQADATIIHLHFYDRNLDKFLPFTATAQSVLGTNGVNHIACPVDLERSVRISANADNSDDFTNSSYAYDKNSDHSGNTTTGATNSDSITNAGVGGETVSDTLKLTSLDNPGGICTALTAYINGKIEITNLTGSGQLELFSKAYSTKNTLTSITSVTSDTNTWSTSELSGYQSTGLLPDEWQIIADYTAEEGEDITGNVTIYDTYLEATLALDFANKPDAAESFLKNVTEVYSYHDGFSKSYSGGSGLAQLPHEIYRDLLARFTDFDYADANWSSWSSLNTARSGWTCRWWLLDQKELKDILEQIQFEGCFIAKMKNTADGINLIWIENSYSSADFTLDENDYFNLELSLTDLNNLQTWTVYNYQKHPALTDYLESVEYKNTSARSDWNAGTNENKATVNLDFITADKVYNSSSHTNPNDCVALYYDNILAEPKIRVSFELINLAHSNIEAGDIIQLNDSYVDPFGKSWANLYFMVESVRRSLGGISVTAREVYES